MNIQTKELKSKILQLIEAGIQAPSADNGQPWNFKISGNELEVWIDIKRLGMFFDVKNIATQMSCGALMENIELMAKGIGVDISITYFDLEESFRGESPFAKVEIVSDHQVNENLSIIQSIFNRHSDRNYFQLDKKIPDEKINQLIQMVQKEKNYTLTLYSNSSSKRIIRNIIVESELIRYKNKIIHDDFYKVLNLYDKKNQVRDGLSLETIGLPSIFFFTLKILKSWKITNFLYTRGFKPIIATIGFWVPMRFSSVFFSLTHHGPANYVEFGKIIQQFWIEANKQQLGVQALGVLPLNLSRIHLLNGEGFTPEQIEEILLLEKEFITINPHFDPKNDQLIMFFRIGVPKKIAKKSLRRKIESFIL